MKKLTQSKTFWVNLLVVIGGAVTGAMGTEVIAENPILLGYAAATVGFINIILRLFTTKPISSI